MENEITSSVWLLGASYIAQVATGDDNIGKWIVAASSLLGVIMLVIKFGDRMWAKPTQERPLQAIECMQAHTDLKHSIQRLVEQGDRTQAAVERAANAVERLAELHHMSESARGQWQSEVRDKFQQLQNGHRKA
jgi:hypothetical protein